MSSLLDKACDDAWKSYTENLKQQIAKVHWRETSHLQEKIYLNRINREILILNMGLKNKVH
jgi:peptide deformylase